MSLFRYSFVCILLYEYLNIQNIQRKNRVSACKQKHFILASCILFLNTWMGKSRVKKKKKKKTFWTKSWKKTMNWIQNDNQNVDGVDQHPKAWQLLLPLHWSTFYSITLHSFDAVLCLMMVLSCASICCFFFFFTFVFWKFCTEYVY